MRASLDLLRYDDTQIAAVAVELIETNKPDGAVLALADAGVSVQTAVLATMLEEHGIPTVILATTLGERLCVPIAHSRIRALPVLAFQTERTDAPEAVAGLLAAARAKIEAGLTQAPRDGGNASATQETSAFLATAPDDPRAFQDWFEASGLGDGLPLLPPTRSAVDDLLASVSDDPDEVIYGPALTSGRILRVRDAGANAAMTACPPIAFPVVLAALRAMAQPDFRLSQAAITTHPSGHAIVFAGGEPSLFGLYGGAGCLGPGHRGNASVGRAVSLAVQHLFGARPGAADLTILGSPAEFTYCFAEDRQGVPWTTLASDFGSDGPGVFVVKAEGPRNVLEHLAITPDPICDGLAGAATSICSNNAYVPGDLLVVINPEHARIFTHAGWSRADLAQAVHERARLPRRATEGRGVAPLRPAFMDALEELPVTRSPSDVHIVVAGAPGPQSMVALPWGYSRGTWQGIVT
jgi:hypothetical protein